MFANKKSILFITKSRGKVTNVSLGGRPAETVVGEFDWSKETLSKSLAKFAKAGGNTIRIVLSEDFAYVTLLSFPPNKIINGEIIRQKAQELIPQDLNQTVWDYKEILNAFPKTSRKIQVVACVRDLFETLSASVNEARLYAEQVEPLSVSLARFTKNHQETILFVYIYNEIFLSLVKKEAVLATKRLDPPLTKEKLDEFAKYSKDQMGLEPEKIIFCGNMGGINLKDYQTENIKIEIQDLSPTISLAYKDPIKNKNEKELNLPLMKTAKPSSAINSQVKKQKSLNLWVLGIIFLLVIISAEIFLYFGF